MRFFVGKTHRKGLYMKELLKTSESVTEGHPDKICDKVAATILDEAIKVSSPLGARAVVAMEVSAKGHERGGSLWLFGEVTLPSGVDLNYESIARSVVHDIGYVDPSYGFYDGMDDLKITISQQSGDIARGVSSKKKKIGAGDQAIVFSGAVAQDGPEYMPMPIMIAHALTNKLTRVYQTRTLPYLRPDGKSQVVVRYHNGRPVAVEDVTIAASHTDHVDRGQIKEDIFKFVVEPTLDAFHFGIDPKTQLIVNGTGKFAEFGPLADAGTTNRKIVVDNTGGRFSVGGGGMNGKDPTKVDVSGPLAARYIAKALVANNLVRKAQIEVSYAIGKPDPRSVYIETFGTRRRGVTEGDLYKFAERVLPLSVGEIIEGLDLFQPRFADASVGGFFGRKEFPWEQVPRF